MSAIVAGAKSFVGRLAVYEPGRPIEEVARELGLADAAGIIKLASNENALGPSPRALDAMRACAADMHIYPDGGSFYLRQAIAARLGVEACQVFMGHGSNEIIALLGHIYLDAHTNAVASQGAFIVYKLVAALYESRLIEAPMVQYGHDLEAMLAAITPQTRLVFVANPNNPTGTMVDGAAIDRFLDRVPPHVVTVFDEAYIELLPPERQPDVLKHVRAGRDVIVLRTFSKTYGLAGLRIGYAVAPAAAVDLLNRVRQPFNVNAMAQAAALAALGDDDHVARTRRMVAEGLAQLGAGFDRLGLPYVPSHANFVLVRTGAGRQVCAALQQRKVIARPVDGYGLPDFLRVTVGTAAENERFLSALAGVLGRT